MPFPGIRHPPLFPLLSPRRDAPGLVDKSHFGPNLQSGATFDRLSILVRCWFSLAQPLLTFIEFNFGIEIFPFLLSLCAFSVERFGR